MSLFGAMTTAIGGLTAQSRALGHISDNVANSQTIGFKRIDTNFVSYVTNSTQRIHAPGSVVARPDYTHNLQGTIEQTENRTALAIAGQGFFTVAAQNGEVNGQPTFDQRQFYTRAGDFTLDRNGYLVNSAGYFLQGWGVDPVTRQIDRSGVLPIRVSQLVSNPVATSEIVLAANLPANPPEGQTTFTSIVPIYDALGEARSISVQWTKAGSNNWRMDVLAPGSSLDPVGGAGTIPGFNDQQMNAFNVTGTVQPVQQTDDIDLPATIVAGTVYSVTINGIVVSYTATSADAALGSPGGQQAVRNQLVSRINTDSATLGVSAVVVDDDTFQLRAVNAGTPYTLATSSSLSVAASVANVTPSYQTDSFVLTGTVGEVGDTYSISLSGITGGFPASRSWTYTTTGEEGSINAIANALAAQINADPDSPALASVQGGILTLKAKNGVPIPSWTVDGGQSSVTVPGGPFAGGEVFTVTLNGADYTYTALAGDTATDVRDALVTAIGTPTGITVTPVGPDQFSLTTAAGAPLEVEVTPTLTAATGGTRTTNGNIPPHIQVSFGAGGDPLRAGTITAISGANVAGGTATVPANQLTGDPAYVDVVLNYGQGPQTVRIFLGSFGLADGVTQFAGSDYALRSLEQNGVPQGSFSSLALNETGDVVINYDNGQSRTIARVPVVTFNEADKLERIDGQAFMRTVESGEAKVLDPGRDGAGKLVVGSVERSNVDMAAEFSKLIVAQRAYTANTRIVTASDEMLLDTLNMKR
ncbi:flagellar hook-basal body complex protein [Elioraea sp. Yellowstone]|jgi:flagellar hook protein FlgE|uniref:flagellar hook-basal body complex protein n=1 Tax=Elioraea sp. Yellowstone TaxID=2592070 RepID=UPI00114DDE09|nr:flagellar hook-basal body complex protein [Elioraea sp. Yellowstone]TQF80240.1 flagellar hook-basal body complex protein [Elioraea sp. Yellowstone]